jgi:DNA polymerase
LHGVRIDIESRSATDIKAGVYRYSEDPTFKVLLLSYSPLRRYAGGTVRPGEPRALDLRDKRLVASFQKLLADPAYEKHAYNANFERVTLSRWMGMPTGTYLDPENWHCSAIKANVSGVFGTLDEVARAVRSPVTKDKEGRRLINLFSKPDKKSGRFHNGLKPECWCGADHRRDMAKFSDYCTQDVRTEAVVAAQFPEMSNEVQAQYEADQRINDRGVRHHSALSIAALAAVEVEVDRLRGEMRRLSGIDNPNSGPQVMAWLEQQGYPMDSLDKAHRADALADPFCPDIVKQVLDLRGQANLTSVAKHTAMLRTCSEDGRIRGSLQFYGAHTGREAGRGFQPQNLPRYEATAKDRERLLKGKAKPKHNIPLIAKGSVRAAILPARGHVFVVPDYNAIEARCLGWQAGEQWVQDEFRGDGKIYERTAETMFGVSKAALVAALKKCDKCGKCPDCIVRGKGKVSDLALGYQGGAGALVTMGAEAAGIDVGNYPELKAEWVRLGSPGKFWEWDRDRHDYPELLMLRDKYRDARPQTVRFWKLCAAAWDQACRGKRAPFGPDGRIVMVRDGRHNRLILPSGRSIWYRFARAHEDPDNPDRIDRRTFIGKSPGVGHMRTDTHGGKLTENITQAIARDALFDMIMRIERKTNKGWPARLVLHVHDEVVLEVPERHADQVLADTLGMMDKTPKWAPGLILKGEGAIMERYGK